jgi:hypothetical protein
LAAANVPLAAANVSLAAANVSLAAANVPLAAANVSVKAEKSWQNTTFMLFPTVYSRCTFALSNYPSSI